MGRKAKCCRVNLTQSRAAAVHRASTDLHQWMLVRTIHGVPSSEEQWRGVEGEEVNAFSDSATSYLWSWGQHHTYAHVRTFRNPWRHEANTKQKDTTVVGDFMRGRAKVGKRRRIKRTQG